MTEPALVERTRQVVDQSVEIIERRVNQLGLVEPSIQRQGNDRVLVQVPGLGNPQQLLDIIGTTAKLTFRLVDTSMSRSSRPCKGGRRRNWTLSTGRRPKIGSPICWKSG